jgi:hypothetical protein
MSRWINFFVAGGLLLSACTPESKPVITPSPTPIPPTSTPNLNPTSTPYIQVFPTTNPDLSIFSVHIQIVRVSRDDGSEMANVSPDDILQQLNNANEILAASSIRFVFDPQTDVDIVQSTVIATMLSEGDQNWQVGMLKADSLAKKYTNKVTIFVRENPVYEPTASDHFFWWNYNFGLISLSNAEICGKTDTTILLHAIGHYLGLGNTYAQVFPDAASAESAYIENGLDSTKFDGDDFSDTTPDIFIDQPEFVCGTDSTLSLANASIPIDRGNVMSGYYPRTSFTPLQISRMRYTLALKQRLGMIMPTNSGIKNPIELETTTIYQANWVATEVKDLSMYNPRDFSGGKGLCALAGYGSSLFISFSVDKTGIFDLNFYGVQTPDGATIEVDVDDVLVNDYINLYGPFIYPSGKIGMGTYYLTEGSHLMEFKVIKMDPLSSGYNFCLDAFTVEFRPQ